MLYMGKTSTSGPTWNFSSFVRKDRLPVQVCAKAQGSSWGSSFNGSVGTGGRDMRCCTDEQSGVEAHEKVEKKDSVAWSIPYFIVGGTEFAAKNAQPTTTVRGA